MELIGYLGGVLLAVCAIPEAYKAFKSGFCDLGWPLLIMWSLGEILTLIYVYPTAMLPLILNYVVNIACLGVMIYYKYTFTRYIERLMDKDSELMLELAKNRDTQL